VLFLVNEEHLAILKQGVEVWNKWRENNPSITPDLSGAYLFKVDLSFAYLGRANLSGADLSFAYLIRANLSGARFIRANLSGADLSFAYLFRAKLFSADLSGADLSGADLSEADLSRANLSYANLRSANLSSANLRITNLSFANLSFAYLFRAKLFSADLSGADLSGADLSEADLSEADLKGTLMIKVKFFNANLSGCRVYGVSAWDLEGLDKVKEQKNLIITPEGEAEITVDNLEVAQFIYLMLHNSKIRDVINTIGQKGVLILGRFGERKYVLEALRSQLRNIGYLPFVFDFENPVDRDFTETVMTLAGMSRFIIADITQPKSVPLELKTIIPNYMIPMVTIIQKGERPFSMFKDLWIQYKDYVLEPLEYDSIEQLQRVFMNAVVDPANQRLEILRKQKAEEMCMRYAKDYEK
jgi:uncharacterized protein YjbI with pentapeptide repeats